MKPGRGSSLFSKGLTAEEAQHLISMAETAVSTHTIEELAGAFLKALVKLIDTPVVFLYFEYERLSLTPFFHTGLPIEMASVVIEACADRFGQLPAHSDLPAESFSLNLEALPPLALFPLERKQSPLGFLGVAQSEAFLSGYAALMQRVPTFLNHALNNLLDRLDYEKQIKDLDTYLSVSTMIAQTVDLRDVLEAVLYFCMDLVGAEAASVLLLDYAKENFRFYSAEGPAKPVLLTASFPADQGLAGSVLRTQQAEIINDVQTDHRFYGKFDADSGFLTRNMIVIRLTAGQEKIGVLEIINKMDGPFFDDDLLVLQTIAEEIAFAIRNAMLFEVAVQSYCKQRQGLNTCKGCQRPLGSWTPCVKYREEAGLLEV